MFDYDSIPDCPNPEEIMPAVSAFAAEKDQLLEEKGLSYTLEQLEKIAEREYYGDFSEEWIKDISGFLIENLKNCEYDDLDLILTLSAQLDLETVWKYIKRKRKSFSDDIQQLIKESYDEMNVYFNPKGVE
ncbi:hypothetical protein [uncultured Ruminococcus sp.]|uniref:hypothetical protein n=1 Tax=uncultured Ruminococcus sp. TaxID=165186 RepID=UPI0026213BAE|nr:hypothetical protein [uncultured Ruminococcus sp.]